jgi:retron-type reverse transcriptase
MGCTSLDHHLDFTWLLAADGGSRRGGAAGGDGMTAADDEADLVADLRSLPDRATAGSYRAPPVRRVPIATGPGPKETRPIGIPTPEDQVLQRAVVMLLQPIHEQDCKPCSYGFVPGRSAHQALGELPHRLRQDGGGWVPGVDIRRSFDTLDPAHWRELLRRGVRDGVVRRLTGTWLNAGVLEGGAVTYPSTGSPRGGVLSPFRANV